MDEVCQELISYAVSFCNETKVILGLILVFVCDLLMKHFAITWTAADNICKGYSMTFNWDMGKNVCLNLIDRYLTNRLHILTLHGDQIIY